MTLSKKHQIIIWIFVLIVVMLVGIGKGTRDLRTKDGVAKDIDTVTFYGIRVASYIYFHKNYDFLSWIESQKYLLLGISALICLAAFITSKTK